MQECGKKCGITTAPRCGKNAVLTTQKKNCIIALMAAPLPVLAGGQRLGEVSSAIFGGRVSPFFLLTYTL